MVKRDFPSSLIFLQVAVAAFFILLGLVGIAYYNSDISRFGRAVIRVFGGRNDILSVLISILCLVSGAILLLGLFMSMKTRLLYASALGVFIFWAVRIFYMFFLNNIFEPDFLVWLQQLSLDLVILSAVWLISRRYA